MSTLRVVEGTFVCGACGEPCRAIMEYDPEATPVFSRVSECCHATAYTQDDWTDRLIEEEELRLDVSWEDIY